MTLHHRSTRLALALVVALCVAAPVAVRALAPAASSSTPEPAAPPIHERWFVDITDEVGLDFFHRVGPLGTFFPAEINGAGGAVFDYDSDGDLDLYLIQSGLSPSFDPRAEVPAFSSEDSLIRVLPPGAHPQGYANRLFRQEADGTFTDVTEPSGLGDTGYGVGVAIGDVDNDGHPDVYVTNCGPDQLYQNNGDGTFTNVTELAGIDNPEYSTGAAFFDYDRDGWLDLFVTNYVDYRIGQTFACADPRGNVGYCGPVMFPWTTDRLFHNEGVQAGPDGRRSVRFTDVTEAAGIAEARTAGFSVLCADFNDDLWPDAYVASDMHANPMWISHPGGGPGGRYFVNEGMARGSALNRDGRPEASMGAALGDIDDDGDLDIFLTHLTGQTNTLYVNMGGLFSDRTDEAGLGAVSLPHTGWGVGLVDLDCDGDLDIPVANGLVTPRHFEGSMHGSASSQRLFHYSVIEDEEAFWREYADPNLLLLNDGTGVFTDASALAGDFTAEVAGARALVFGDLDDDGDLDMLVTRCGGRAQLLRNEAPRRGHWLTVRAYDPLLHRDAYGALVTVRAGERAFHRLVQPSYSYLASNDPRAHFGLADHPDFDELLVVWPDGLAETFAGGAADREIVVRRGAGTPLPMPAARASDGEQG